MKQILASFASLRRSRAHSATSFRRVAARSAFSLIELMSVVTIITVLAGVSVPAVKGISGGNSVSIAGGKIGGLLTLARSEAIAQHTIVRFVVATDWKSKDADASCRRMSLWAWREDVARYEQIGNWEELPTGVILERGLPAYVQTAPYVSADPSTVRGTCVLDGLSGAAECTMETTQGQITGRYIEFLPSGAARIPGSTDRRTMFVATQGYANPDGRLTYTAGGRPSNWAQVNVDTLTGRVHVYRP